MLGYFLINSLLLFPLTFIFLNVLLYKFDHYQFTHIFYQPFLCRSKFSINIKYKFYHHFNLLTPHAHNHPPHALHQQNIKKHHCFLKPTRLRFRKKKSKTNPCPQNNKFQLGSPFLSSTTFLLIYPPFFLHPLAFFFFGVLLQKF